MFAHVFLRKIAETCNRKVKAVSYIYINEANILFQIKSRLAVAMFNFTDNLAVYVSCGVLTNCNMAG